VRAVEGSGQLPGVPAPPPAPVVAADALAADAASPSPPPASPAPAEGSAASKPPRPGSGGSGRPGSAGGGRSGFSASASSAGAAASAPGAKASGASAAAGKALKHTTSQAEQQQQLELAAAAAHPPGPPLPDPLRVDTTLVNELLLRVAASAERHPHAEANVRLASLLNPAPENLRRLQSSRRDQHPSRDLAAVEATTEKAPSLAPSPRLPAAAGTANQSTAAPPSNSSAQPSAQAPTNSGRPRGHPPVKHTGTQGVLPRSLQWRPGWCLALVLVVLARAVPLLVQASAASQLWLPVEPPAMAVVVAVQRQL
jgi:hypothetical protein